MKTKTAPSASDPRSMPAYPLAEAARYVHIAPATLRSWCLGRPYQRRDGVARFTPLIRLPAPRTGTLSFHNLVEAHVLRALRTEHGVPIKALREAIRYAEQSLRIERILLRKELCTHAGEVFLEHYGDLISLSKSGQLAMRKLLEAHLKRVEWDVRDVPRRLYPFGQGERTDSPRNIMIDAAIAFGRPVIVTRGVSTRAIADRIDAGESVEELAADYDLSQTDIEEAVVYERVA
jgi:uncharacterized protein (DUF433 family)